MKRLLMLFLLLLPLPAYAAPERWVIYYADKLPAKAFMDFDVIAFDGQNHPPIAPLQAKGKIVLGYISLGEAENYRNYFKRIKKAKLLMHENPEWKGHFVVDVRNPEWTRIVLDELIPPILAQGFDGLIIDTIDSAIYPEIEHPERYPGMIDASVALLKTVRARYPNIKIMLNRGFDILPRVASDIDMLMAENTLGDWQPSKKNPDWVTSKDYDEYLRIIKESQAISPALKIYTMDYWRAKDKKTIRRIYATQRAQGFVPYVGPLDLQSVWKEP